MKEIVSLLFASLFVLISLLGLITAERTPESTRVALSDDHDTVTDLGLRVTFKR
jgi:hypothetical protein